VTLNTIKQTNKICFNITI